MLINSRCRKVMGSILVGSVLGFPQLFLLPDTGGKKSWVFAILSSVVFLFAFLLHASFLICFCRRLSRADYQVIRPNPSMLALRMSECFCGWHHLLRDHVALLTNVQQLRGVPWNFDQRTTQALIFRVRKIGFDLATHHEHRYRS